MEHSLQYFTRGKPVNNMECDFITYPLNPNSCPLYSANHHYHNYCKTQNCVVAILQPNAHTSINILIKTLILNLLNFITKLFKIAVSPFANIVFSLQILLVILHPEQKYYTLRLVTVSLL